jgi:hypothetical protein
MHGGSACASRDLRPDLRVRGRTGVRAARALARSREGSERQVGAFLVLLGAGLALRLAAVAARASSSR